MPWRCPACLSKGEVSTIGDVGRHVVVDYSLEHPGGRMGSFASEVAPWTEDQARRWRAAVLPRWLDPRWSALGRLTGLVLLIGLEGDGIDCGSGAGQQPCPSQWIDGAFGAIVVGQVGLVFAAPAVGSVTRR